MFWLPGCGCPGFQGQVDNQGQIRAYFSPRGGCQEAIAREIDQAKKTIDVAMYCFTSKPLADALVGAEKREVRVRLYLDESQKTGKWSKAKELEAGGCEIRFEDDPGLTHNSQKHITGPVQRRPRIVRIFW